ILLILPGPHARRRASTEADQHPRPAQLYQRRTCSEFHLVDLRCRDVSDTTRDHDRFVVAALLSGHVLFERTKITHQVRTTELIVERGPTDRTLEHDLKSRCDPARSPVALLAA